MTTTTDSKVASNANMLSGLAPYAHWFPRIALATVFLYHGILKIMNVGGFADMMGLSTPIAWLVTLAELGAGILLIAGAFSSDMLTRIGGLLVIPVMLGAIFMVHLANGFNFMNNGFEFQFVLLLLGVYFAAVGNGHNH